MNVRDPCIADYRDTAKRHREGARKTIEWRDCPLAKWVKKNVHVQLHNRQPTVYMIRKRVFDPSRRRGCCARH